MIFSQIRKRGLSDVVTTVLIILLVLAAIVIIWTFIKPAIQSVGQVASADCLKVDLAPVSCVYSNGTGLNATYTLNADGGASLGSLSVLATLKDGSVKPITVASAPALYSSAMIVRDTTTGATQTNPVVKVQVVASVKDDSGAQYSCQPNNQFVTCPQVG